MRREIDRLPHARMRTDPDQAALLTFLVRLVGARKALEVGTFRGYSAVAIVAGLAEGGRLVACDVSDEFTRDARRYWEEAGIAERVDLRLGPATATLDALLHAGEAGAYDFAFVDADKSSYDAYYERALRLLRAGGLIVFDNVLWGGDVADERIHDEDTDALRALNAKIRDDARVDAALVTIGDGFMLARKR